jgi:hypothetical protein
LVFWEASTRNSSDDLGRDYFPDMISFHVKSEARRALDLLDYCQLIPIHMLMAPGICIAYPTEWKKEFFESIPS